MAAQEKERRRPWALLNLYGVESEVRLAMRRAVLSERFDFAHVHQTVLQRNRQNRAPGVAVVTIDGRNSRTNATDYRCAVPSCTYVSDHQCPDCRVWICDDHGPAHDRHNGPDQVDDIVAAEYHAHLARIEMPVAGPRPAGPAAPNLRSSEGCRQFLREKGVHE